MFEAHSINVEHKDLIHDVSYDFYGLRLATCSSDQFVKVWDQDEQGNWRQSACWKAHAGSVWKVTWAHPEFGQVLATCSFDRTAAVWEEIVGEGSGPGERGMRHWVRRNNFVDSRTSVTDIKFAPKHLGLLLATCSADSVVRIYEAPDVMNLSQWTLQHEISCKLPFSCLSWNPSLSRLHPPMLAVGSDDSNSSSGGKVFIFEYSENTRRWNKPDTLPSVTDAVHDLAFAPNLGRSFHLLAVATKDVRIYTLRPLTDASSMQSGLNRFDIQLSAQCDDHSCTVWRVCWNITGTLLASSGDDGCVRLWKPSAYSQTNYLHNWKCVSVLKGDGTQPQGEMTPTALATPVGVMASATQSTASPRLMMDELSSLSSPHQPPAPASKWQAPVMKGRFQKMTWLGSDPPPPPVEKSKPFKK